MLPLAAAAIRKNVFNPEGYCAASRPKGFEVEIDIW